MGEVPDVREPSESQRMEVEMMSREGCEGDYKDNPR